MANNQVFGAFNQGEIPTIACFNKAAMALGVDFDALIGGQGRDRVGLEIAPAVAL